MVWNLVQRSCNCADPRWTLDWPGAELDQNGNSRNKGIPSQASAGKHSLHVCLMTLELLRLMRSITRGRQGQHPGEHGSLGAIAGRRRLATVWIIKRVTNITVVITGVE